MEMGPVGRTNWLLALAEPFVTVLAHGNGVYQVFESYCSEPYHRTPQLSLVANISESGWLVQYFYQPTVISVRLRLVSPGERQCPRIGEFWWKPTPYSR